MDLNPETPVTITMRQIYWVVGAIAVAAVTTVLATWAVDVWTVGGIREDITHLKGNDSDNNRRIADVNVKFADQMQGLHADLNNLRTDIKGLGTDLKYFSDRVEGVNKSITGLDAGIGKLDAQLASFQSAWTDPKYAAGFVENLKKSGIEADKIVIVPLVPPPPH
jgi:hypothetical protein